MVLAEANVDIPVFSEEDCVGYFFSLKWPDGFRCPQCGHSRHYTIQTRRLPLYQCYNCQHQTTITAGTVMERSRTPLHKWRIAFELFSQPSSVNAVQLSKMISVTYKTAWLMLHKIRQAVSEKEATQPLEGKVRAGVGIYGKRTLQPYYLHPKERPVMVSATFQDGEPAYVKLKLISYEHMEGKRSLLHSGEVAFMKQHVQPDTFDMRFLKRSWFQSTPLPRIFDQAKKWIDRTFHGIGITYLQAYWDEFCFRLNQFYLNNSVMEALCAICMSSQAQRT
ncbi:transposase [Paenibacillus alkalitolerans]|uniref:transposase n=1 Tax=Paenibacillus alkalitolerans TaxID=2799335 RepID=UPI0018F75BAC|nr:transposase [Paenibacillus alkalitolerans]